jgi:RHS repeat-associated protein
MRHRSGFGLAFHNAAAAGTPELAREENWYDPASRITRRVSGGVTTGFGYDDVGQILSESDWGGYSAAYTYDANGNRLTKTTGGVTQTYATDSGDKLTGITYSDSTPAKNFTYHFSGRCTGFTQGAITRTYTWDKECRITGVSETGQTSVGYGYNGFDARATRTFGGATTAFKRDGADPVDAVLSDISPGTTARYLPGISEQRNGVSTYFHEGIKNAITQTNASQSVTATKRYDAFGLQVASTGAWKSPFAYGGPWGYQEDGDAYGMKLLGHRYYDPSTGRFLSRDIARDGRSWYAYCRNNPLGFADPSGLIPKWLEIALRLYDLYLNIVNGSGSESPPFEPMKPPAPLPPPVVRPMTPPGEPDPPGGSGGGLGGVATIAVGAGVAAEGIRVVYKQRKRLQKIADEALCGEDPDAPDPLAGECD